MVQNGSRKLVRSRFRQDKGHRAIWEAFSHAITQSGPPPIPYEQIFGVTEATFAAVMALRTRKTIEIGSEVECPDCP